MNTTFYQRFSMRRWILNNCKQCTVGNNLPLQVIVTCKWRSEEKTNTCHDTDE